MTWLSIAETHDSHGSPILTRHSSCFFFGGTWNPVDAAALSGGETGAYHPPGKLDFWVGVDKAILRDW